MASESDSDRRLRITTNGYTFDSVLLTRYFERLIEEKLKGGMCTSCEEMILTAYLLQDVLRTVLWVQSICKS